MKKLVSDLFEVRIGRLAKKRGIEQVVFILGNGIRFLVAPNRDRTSRAKRGFMQRPYGGQQAALRSATNLRLMISITNYLDAIAPAQP